MLHQQQLSPHYQEMQPPPGLAPYIQCIWTVERDFAAINGVIDILPDSFTELIFNSAPCCIETPHMRHTVHSPYLVFPMDTPFRLRSAGIVRTTGIRFYAWGLYGLLHPHAHQPDWSPAKFTAQTRSATQIAHDLYLSRRQFERLFRQQTGMSPAQFRRLDRFTHLRNYLSGQDQSSVHNLATLAQRSGYADQAHMSRAFKEYAGRTPRQFLHEISSVAACLRYGVAFPEL